MERKILTAYRGVRPKSGFTPRLYLSFRFKHRAKRETNGNFTIEKVIAVKVTARLRAAVQVTQETNYSVPLERLAGMKPF